MPGSDITEPHEDLTRPAAEEAREEAQEPAHDGRHEHRAQADEEGHARAVEHTRERVAPELVGAEGMPGRAGRSQTLGHVADEGVVGSQDRRGERREHCRRREDEAEEAEAVPPDRGRLHAATSRLVRGSSHPYRRSTPRLMRV